MKQFGEFLPHKYFIDVWKSFCRVSGFLSNLICHYYALAYFNKDGFKQI